MSKTAVYAGVKLAGADQAFVVWVCSLVSVFRDY